MAVDKAEYWTPSGKLIDDCEGCGKHGIIASNVTGKKLCRDCDVKGKATDAGMDAMREDKT